MKELYDWENSIDLHGTDASGNEWSYDNVMPKDLTQAEGKKMYKDFLSNTQPIINSMAQTFEMKKAAAANKKAQVAKTGKLNEDRLWAYQLTEDLFQKNMIVPNGKNHGILMYVDLSGSMNRQMPGTLEQMMNMALFCRKVWESMPEWVKRLFPQRAPREEFIDHTWQYLLLLAGFTYQ